MPKLKTLVRSPLVAAAIVLATAGEAAAIAYGDYTGSGIRIRTCANSGCTVLGLGYPGQGVAVTCGVSGEGVNGNYLWFYHRNRTTGVTGYSSAEYIGLSSGSWYYPC